VAGRRGGGAGVDGVDVEAAEERSLAHEVRQERVDAWIGEETGELWVVSEEVPDATSAGVIDRSGGVEELGRTVSESGGLGMS
jgi:hypothetical protein